MSCTAERVPYNVNIVNKNDDVHVSVSIESKNSNHLESITLKHVTNINDLDSYYKH